MNRQFKKPEEWLSAFEEPSPDAIEVPVLDVFDGEGFLKKIDRRIFTNDMSDESKTEVGVRFAFIDAPELNQVGGPEARELLNSLIGGKKVWIEIRMKMSSGKFVDQFDRLIAVPFFGDHYPASMFENERRTRPETASVAP